ncbi:MAG: hypothetical protein AB1324_01555 [Candidatus Micrarchaeota archaeon]
MTTVRFGSQINRVTLFHGSPVSGITKFDPECETFDRPGNDTLGTGTYFTASEPCAEKYAILRSRQFRTGTPTVYRAALSDVSVVDLREREVRIAALQEFMAFLRMLREAGNGAPHDFGVHGKLAEIHLRAPRSSRYRVERIISDSLAEYRENPQPDDVRTVLDTGYSIIPGYFSRYLQAFGNHGLISAEGTDWHIGGADSWLVFEHYPNLQIVSERKLPA